ncbi:MAG TPA: hypothetical protein VEI01_19845 [Terriglobales bacterium]|nr:hypothetical protein [Terriglobales bacterium]
MFAELVEREDIRPAPYLGRYRWVMLDRPDAPGEGELQNLIGQSYQMVAIKAGKSKTANRQNRARTPRRGWLGKAAGQK